MSLVPVPSEQPNANCADCGAVLVADQRYCLSCGQPVSPVRLAFLDALTPAAPAPAQTAWAVPSTIEGTAVGYLPPASEQGANAWLKRNSGLLGLFTVLLLCLLVGLLVGHWVSQSKAPANQVVKVEGLAGLAATGSGSTGSSGTSTTSSGSSSHSSTPTAPASTPKQEKAEVEEAKKIEKQPLAQPKKATTTIQKLSKSTGKKHHEEIEAQGATPLETG